MYDGMIEKRKGRNNCPNCGAPIESEICKFCGTRFIDFASMSTDEPFWIKVIIKGRMVKMKVNIRNIELKQQKPYVEDYCDSSIPCIYETETPEVDMSFKVIHVDGVYFTEEIGARKNEIQI